MVSTLKIFHRVEGARNTEKFKIVQMPLKQAASAYWAMSKSGKLLLSVYDLD